MNTTHAGTSRARASTQGFRSLCPINLALEQFGDRWTLLILRDLIFAGKRHFGEMLRSEEGISTNILSDRLKMLLDNGIITRGDDPTHRQKAIYSLTEKGIDLVPIFAHICAWGHRHIPASEELCIGSRPLEECGPAVWQALMAELRESHLSSPQITPRLATAGSPREAS